MSMCDVPSRPPEQPCPTCRRQLPRTIDFYHRDAMGRQGLKRRCRTCINAAERRRYAASSAVIRERVRQRRAERAELFRNSPQWQSTPHHQAVDDTRSTASFMPYER